MKKKLYKVYEDIEYYKYCDNIEYIRFLGFFFIKSISIDIIEVVLLKDFFWMIFLGDICKVIIFN